jgi:hypothetical protein
MDSSHLTTSLALASNHNDTNEEERTMAMAMPVSECEEDEFKEEDEEGKVNLPEAVVTKTSTRRKPGRKPGKCNRLPTYGDFTFSPIF